MERERAQRLAARPEDDFADRLAKLGEDKVYNVSNFTSLGRGARPLSKETAKKNGLYSIPEEPRLVSDNRLTLELALKNLGKWDKKIERSVESSFGEQKRTSPKGKKAVKKQSPKKEEKKEEPKGPKKATKKESPTKEEPKKPGKIPAKTLKKFSPPKETTLPPNRYSVEVKGTKAKVSPRNFNYEVSPQGIVLR